MYDFLIDLYFNYLCKYDICDFIRLLLIEYPIKARNFPALHFDWLNAHDDTMIWLAGAKLFIITSMVKNESTFWKKMATFDLVRKEQVDWKKPQKLS